jgi:tryptophanyl-tRNA synthetase
MPRIFSGIQPSGELHIGNYLGAVKNWVALQHAHESFFCIVNYHAITIAFAPDELRRRTRDMAISLLASGLDPAKCVVFVQSDVPEHTELAWIFNTITPLGELERQVQFKDKAGRSEQVMAGLLNYPVLQAADILLYLADTVPVGEDQVQHLELSRVVARNWNTRFSPDAPYFPEPQPKLTPTRRIAGLDGQAKMSKSIGNTIGLLESPDAIWEKLRPVVTDPARQRKTDAGRAREMPGDLSAAQGVLVAGDGHPGGDQLPRRAVGLHRMQEGAAREHGAGVDADSFAGAGIAGRPCPGRCVVEPRVARRRGSWGARRWPR